MSGVQAPRSGRRQAGQATPSVVTVVSVVAIVVALVAFFAGGDDSDAPRAGAPATESATRTTEPQGPPTAARTPRREKPDGDTARADRKEDKDRQRRQGRRRPERDTGPPDVYVEVYNNTSISGLAASTGAELQDAGWQVVGVDNWYGDIPENTVYYPAGLEDEADQLAEELGIDRVRGAVAPMKFDRLTVILTGGTG